MTQISYKDDYYNPTRPRVVPAAGMVAAGTVLLTVALNVAEKPMIWQILTLLLGIGATIAVVIGRRRSWMKRHARPALMRQSIAHVIGQPLPERVAGQNGRTLLATRYRWGTWIEPGPAQRIVLRARFLATLDPMMVEQITQTLGRCEGTEYICKRNKRRPERFVFTPKPEEKPVELTPAQQIKQRFDRAAKEVLGPGAAVAYQWDEKEPDFLIGAEITGFNGMDVSLTGKQRQAATRLSSQLPDPSAFKYAVFPHEDRFTFARSAPLPGIVMPPKSCAELIRDHRAYRKFEIPLGIGPNGAEAVWCPVRDAHLLIIGGTGGGKTICEHGVIQQLSQAGWRTWLVDGKMIEFLGYENWPNVEFLAQDVDAQIRLIHLAHETMNARYSLIRDGKVRIEELDPIAVVIDEVTSLLAAVEQRYADTKEKGMKSKPPVLDWLGNIARLGRSAKMHLVYGMQRPDTTIIDGEQRDNFGARISLGKLKSSAGSVMMWDNHAIGCQVPPIPGRAISLIDNQPTMIQATLNASPNPSHDDYNPGIIAAMTPPEQIYGFKRILEPTPQLDPDSGETQDVVWSDILESKIVDSNNEEIIFDPVASEESRQMRRRPATPARGAASDHHLQAADTFEEGLALFPAPGGAHAPTLQYGAQLAAAIRRSLDESCFVLDEAEESVPSRTPASAPLPRMAPAMGGPDGTGPQYTTTAAALEPGNYAEIDQLGAEIMVSEAQNTGNGVIVVGYTADGEELSVELTPTTDVQVREAPAEDNEDFYEDAA